MQSPVKRQRTGPDPAQQPASQPGAMCTLQEHRDRAIGCLSGRLCAARRHACMSMDVRPSLQEIQNDLVQLMEGTICGRENASMLVLGEPGCGKTLVIERAMHTIASKHNTDPGNPAVGFVRISGLLHAEERAAFLEVAHQLCTSFNISFSKTSTYDDNLTFLKQVLAELQRAFKSVVFVVDVVEGFLRLPKQTLLYNLLDALTSSQVQAAVLGVSCCWDLQGMMEKRVRSRFSQKKVVVPALRAEPSGDSHAAVLTTMLQLPDSFEPQQRTKQYNSGLAGILGDKEVKANLQKLASFGATPKELSAIALGALINWQLRGGPSTPFMAAHLQAACEQFLGSLDTRVEALLGCSVLELALLVAARRVEDRGQPTFNFEMVLEEFMKVRQEQLGYLFRRPAAWRAFKDLAAKGLLQFNTSRPESRGLLQPYLPAQLLVGGWELEQGLEQHPQCPDLFRRWLKGEQGVAGLRG